jgi:hypothetical protein
VISEGNKLSFKYAVYAPVGGVTAPPKTAFLEYSDFKF